jgi:hypothetical protein
VLFRSHERHLVLPASVIFEIKDPGHLFHFSKVYSNVDSSFELE